MNKHSNNYRFILSIFLVFTLLLHIPAYTFAKEYEDKKADYDIIFVLDVSASMKTTDKNRNSIEIIKMMIDMSTGGQNRIGYVAYNDTITTHFSLADVSNNALRSDLKQTIDKTEFSGYTDMGLGLKYATNLITKSEAIGNHPIIILLSDGETDLSGSKSGRTDKDSRKDIESSIKTATKNEIPIYTIGLTGDYNTNLDYLKDISDRTKAISYTATSPYQLVDIFNGILSENTSSVLTPVENQTATGTEQYMDIKVSDESLSELNIMLLSEGNITTEEVLTSSKDYSVISSRTYQLIKLYEPVMETIRIKIKADKGSTIRLSTLGVYDFSDMVTIPDTVTKGKSSKITFQFYDTRKKALVSDEKLYQNLNLDFYVKDLSSGEEIKYPAIAGADGYSFEPVLEKSGSYELRTSYKGDTIFGETKVIAFDVNNNPPIKVKDIDETFAKTKTARIYNMDELFTDDDNDLLTYSIVSNQGARMETLLTQNQLSITPLATGDTTIIIQARDTAGDTATASITVKTLPIWKYHYKITITISISAAILVITVITFCIIHYIRKRAAMPKPAFTGVLVGYFLSTKEDMEIPPLKWLLTDYPNKGLSLAKLLKSRGIDTTLPDAEKIWFSPKVGNSIELIHNTRDTILIGSRTVAKNTPVIIYPSDKIFIAFEDMTTELELRYKLQ
ncbi:hypothetical protein acsn021_05980 [Anaerocolumna cellulosilytica]|uniref:Uncharacterized protein n=1 Tax=Anaerocolumna cellulosilytica TaxID=433286 RepID=A0A6S6QVB8_9FIRM|nr:VWA domain-containing protein [Anaerocolumna cellulosilytica]MBB5197759.1 Mg-chelatase subunit ChlD [Anaerocolumna cellulosilytica]BCJ93029.1 hypothetical protein acsn021_05980 [Anaerocolumna cellulosilytica]